MKNQTIITILITISIMSSIVYGMFTGDFGLFEKVIEIMQVPLGVIVAYYFGIRYSPEK